MAIDTLGANALASNSVTSAKIADGAVVAADVADGSVTTAKLADDAITGAKLANDISISTTGNIATTGSGTLSVAGTAAITGAITASAGVAVGGTGDVNTLDDYEEGTFEIKLRNITAGVDTNAKTCRYVKIGKMVMIQWPDGGTGAAGQYWTDNTASGSAAAAGVKFGVSTSTGYNALPFLPKGTGNSGIAFMRGLRSGDGDSPSAHSFGIGWRGGIAQLRIGRFTTDGNEYSIYGGYDAADQNIFLEKNSTQSNVQFSCDFVYYTDA